MTLKNTMAINEDPERWKPIFIEALRQTGHISNSCETAQVSRTTVYNHRHADETFAAEWDKAIDDAGFALQDEAVRRAKEGVDEPIVYKGKIVGTQKRYSDTLLIFLLKGIKPDMYGDKLVVRINPEEAALLSKYGLSASEAWERMMQELANANNE